MFLSVFGRTNHAHDESSLAGVFPLVMTACGGNDGPPPLPPIPPAASAAPSSSPAVVTTDASVPMDAGVGAPRVTQLKSKSIPLPDVTVRFRTTTSRSTEH